MSGPPALVVAALALMGAGWFAQRARAEHRAARTVRILGLWPPAGSTAPSLGRRAGSWERLRDALSTRVALGLLGGAAGWTLAGPPGLVVGVVAGWVGPAIRARRRAGGMAETLERQLAEVVETAALAVRAGLAVAQALEFASEEVEEPMAGHLRLLLQEQAVGTPFEVAAGHFADRVGSDDARLVALVLGIHTRSGGNLSGALEDVAGTIRHRVAVRRDLRALSAQGRVSGAILGSLPILFFLVLAATSRRELAPVYRSSAGLAMVGAGLVLEGGAYLWIRRLMRVEV